MTLTGTTLSDLEALAREEPFIRALARSLLKDDGHAEDVVQQTMIEAWQRGTPKGQARRGWLARVVRSRASNVQRGEDRRISRERAVARPEAVPAADEMLVRGEQRRKVVEAVATLSEPYRTAVMLRYLENLPPHAIASRLGVPRGTVATRLKRALAMLRERLDVEHGGDRRAWATALAPLAFGPARGAAGALVPNLLGFLATLSAMKHLLILVGAALAVLFLSRWALDRRDDSSPLSDVVTAEPGARVAAADEGGAPPGAPAPLTRAGVPAAAPAAGGEPGEPLDSGFAALIGRVVSPDGAPAAGRLCRLWSFDPLTGFGSGVDLGGRAAAAGPQFVEVTTDEHGAFAFDRVPPGGLHALWLAHDGPHASWRPLHHTPGPGERVDLGVLVLDVRASITGAVVGPDGEPVAGAEVWAADLPGAILGVAPVDRIRPGGALLIALPTASDGVPEVDGSVAATAAFAVAVRHHLTAWVLQAEGGARFQVLPYPGWLSRLCAELPLPRTTTDAEGRFELGGVTPGDNVLVVRAPGLAHGGKPRVRVRQGERRDVGALRLRTGETFTAQVVDGAGAPVSGAEVRVAVRPRLGLTGILFADPARRTDADGWVTFGGLPRGDVVLAFRPAVGDPWVTDGPFDAGEEVELRMPARGGLGLSVRSAAGGPLENLVLRLRQGPPFGEATSVGLQALLDPDRHVEVLEAGDAGVARVRLHDLVPGVYTVSVGAAGHASTTRVVAVTAAEREPAGGDPVEVELTPAIDVTVVVVDQDQRPVVGAEVFVRSDADGAAGWDVSLLQDYGSVGGWSRLVRSVGRTDAAGAVRAPGLPGGPSVVVARHRARGVAAVRVEDLPELVQVVLAAPGDIEGRLFDHGIPVSGDDFELVATAISDPAMSVAGLPDLEFRTRPANDGVFRFAGLAPGRWTITVNERDEASVRSLGELILAMKPRIRWFAPGERSVVVEVRSGETGRIEFDVDPTVAVPGQGFQVSGAVTIDGRPAAGVELRSVVRTGIFSDVDTLFATTAADGTFVRTDVARQPFSLTLAAGPFKVGRVERPVEPGEATAVDVSLPLRSARLRLRVIGFTGAPAAGDSVVLRAGLDATDATFLAVLNLDDRGALDVVVPAGSYSIRVEGISGAGRLDGVVVEGTTGRELRLGTQGLVIGRVRFEGPVQRVMLALRAADGSHWSMLQLDEAGAFAFTGIPAGSYVLELSDGESLMLEPSTLEIGEDGLVDQVLRAVGR